MLSREASSRKPRTQSTSGPLAAARGNSKPMHRSRSATDQVPRQSDLKLPLRPLFGSFMDNGPLHTNPSPSLRGAEFNPFDVKVPLPPQSTRKPAVPMQASEPSHQPSHVSRTIGSIFVLFIEIRCKGTFAEYVSYCFVFSRHIQYSVIKLLILLQDKASNYSLKKPRAFRNHSGRDVSYHSSSNSRGL